MSSDSDESAALLPHRASGAAVEKQPGGTPWGRIFLASFNFINATMGAGILGLPKMIASSGVVFGPLVIVFLGLLSNYSLRLLHSVSLQSGRATYESVAGHLSGRYLAHAVSAAIVLINFGACVAYMIVICDFLQPIMVTVFDAQSILADRKLLTALVALLCFLPLSLMKNISSLQFTSALSIFLTLGFAGIVVVRCFVPDYAGIKPTLAPQSIQFFQGLGIALFAFDCSSNLIPIVVEMGADNTPRNGALVIVVTTTVTTVTYVVTGVFGFLSFGAQTDGNILNNYPPTDVLINVMRAIMAVNIACTFPLAMFPLRVSVDEVVMSSPVTAKLCCNSRRRDDTGTNTNHDTDTSHDNDEQQPLVYSGGGDALPYDHVMVGYVPTTRWRLRFVLQVTVLLIASYLLAILLPKVDFVFSIVGSTASACLSYIFPSVIWLSARHTLDKSSMYYRRNIVVCPMLIVFGIVLGAFGTVMSILELF